MSEMPVFVLKAKDNFTPVLIAMHAELCRENGLEDQYKEDSKALAEIHKWRRMNPELCKMPDHKHVPVEEVNG